MTKSYRAALRSPHVKDFGDFEFVFLPSFRDQNVFDPRTFVQGAVRLKVVDGIPEQIERICQGVDYEPLILSTAAKEAYRERLVPEQSFVMRVWDVDILMNLVEMFPVLDHLFFCNLGTRKPFSVTIVCHGEDGEVYACLERYYQFGSIIPIVHSLPGSIIESFDDHRTSMYVYEITKRWQVLPEVGVMSEMNYITSTYLEHIDGFEDLNQFWETFWNYSIKLNDSIGITPNTLPSWMLEHFLMTEFSAFDAGHHVTLALIMKHLVHSGYLILDCKTPDGEFRRGRIFTDKVVDAILLDRSSG